MTSFLGTDVAALEEALRLLAAAGHDLRDYRPEPLLRRARQRAEAAGAADLPAYVAALPAAPGELGRLASALLLHVTGFFRDARVFEALRAAVLPALVERPAPLRCWSIGTATGEEAWSVAALLEEARPGAWEVLATDRDPESLAVASAAAYPADALDGAPAWARAAALEPGAGGDALPLRAALRGRVRFARHDLLGARLAPSEAVLASFELVLCRNVLVYLDDRMRPLALARALAALEPGGALVLGAAEAPPPSAPVAPWPGLDPALRIFRRRAG
ncbi:MAG: chemotaxis protein CheR [Planctomycetes bacterium]|nr:chemotaxis protein CheR [Planctomycetota bacterium]